MTHICLAAASEEVLAGALRTAWKLRLQKNAKSGQKKRPSKERIPAAQLRKAKAGKTKPRGKK